MRSSPPEQSALANKAPYLTTVLMRSSMLKRGSRLGLIASTVLAIAAGTAAAQPPKATTGGPAEAPPGIIQARYGTANLRHEQPVQAVALSPDGKFITSSARDFSIRVWDRATGAPVHSLIQPTNRLAYGAVEASTPCLLYSADGQLLAAGRGDGTILIWETKHYKLLHKLTGSTRSVVALAIAPDSKTGVSADEEQTVRLWDLKTGKEIRQITVSEHATTLGFSKSGELLFAGCQDGSIRIWQLDPLIQLRTIDAHERAVVQLAVAPNGFQIASVSSDARIRFWDTRVHSNPQAAPLIWNVFSGFPQCALANVLASLHWAALNRDDGKVTASGEPVSCIRFLPDGTLLESDSQGLTLWNIASAHPRRSIPIQGITTVEVDREGHVAATGDENGIVRLWDLTSQKELLIAPGPIWPPEQIAEGGRGPEVCVAYRNGPALEWGRAPGREGVRLGSAASGRGVLSAGGLFAAVMDPAGISIFELPDAKPRSRMELAGKDVAAFALDPRGQYLARAGEDKSLAGWSVATGKSLWQIEGLVAPLRTLRYLSDEKRIAGCSGNDALVVWSARSGVELHRLFESGANIVSWAISADGTMAATGHPDGIVRIWQIDSGRLLHVLDGHPGPVHAVAFSNDSRTLAVGSWLTMRLWELASGKERLRIFDLPGLCTAATILPRGEAMLVGMSNTQVLRISLAPPELVTRAWTSAELGNFWKELEGADAARAFQAMAAMASSPEAAVALLRSHLRPVPPLSEALQLQQKQAIDNLGNEKFEVRHQAAESLEQLAETAESALRIALSKNPSSESRSRIQDLLQKLESPERKKQRLRVTRSCELLERVATPEARRLLSELSKGADGAWLTVTAAAGLDRIEKSQTAK